MKLFAPLTKTFVTQKFGVNPFAYRQFGMQGHNGIDYRTRFSDTPLGHRHVRSLASGVVSEVTDQRKAGYGLFVRIDHADGSQSVYGHFYKVFVKKGQVITRNSLEGGTVLGLSGNSGWSSGPHLHVGFRPSNWKAKYNNGFKGYIDFSAQIGA